MYIVMIYMYDSSQAKDAAIAHFPSGSIPHSKRIIIWSTDNSISTELEAGNLYVHAHVTCVQIIGT